MDVVHGSGSRSGRDAARSGEEKMQKVPMERPRVTIWNIKSKSASRSQLATEPSPRRASRSASSNDPLLVYIFVLLGVRILPLSPSFFLSLFHSLSCWLARLPAPLVLKLIPIYSPVARRPISTILLSHNPVSMTFHPSAYQLLIVCMDKTAVDYGVFCWQKETSIMAEAINETYGSPLDREVRPTDTIDPASNSLKDDTAIDASERRKRKEDVESRLAHQRRAETEGDEGWTIRRDVELVLKARSEELRGRGFDGGVSEVCGDDINIRVFKGQGQRANVSARLA